MSKVMDLQLPSKQKFVLLCIANNADDFGGAFPSVTSLSQDTCIPERTVQRLIGWLVEHDYVISYWDFHPKDKLRRKKIRHFRLNLSGKPVTIQPDYSNCPRVLRLEVIQRFNKMCSYCGQTGTDTSGPDKKPWEIDRIIPGSKGGGYVADNVTLSCGPCNRVKGAKVAPQQASEMAPPEGANPASLGAILDKQGCHSEQSVVPPVAHYTSINHQLTVKQPSPHARLMAFHDSHLVGGIADAGAQGSAVKWLLERFTPDQCEAEYQKLAGEEWRTTPVTWLTVKKHIGGDLARAIQAAPNGLSPAGEKILSDYGDWYTVQGVDGTPTKMYRTVEAFARETGRNLEEVKAKWN